jgi:hypothetical protein
MRKQKNKKKTKLRLKRESVGNLGSSSGGASPVEYIVVVTVTAVADLAGRTRAMTELSKAASRLK